jgi:hypothetical protein
MLTIHNIEEFAHNIPLDIDNISAPAYNMIQIRYAGTEVLDELYDTNGDPHGQYGFDVRYYDTNNRASLIGRMYLSRTTHRSKDGFDYYKLIFPFSQTSIPYQTAVPGAKMEAEVTTHLVLSDAKSFKLFLTMWIQSNLIPPIA